MLREEYCRWVAAGYSRVPLVREVVVDLETALGTYLKLANAPFTYLLESLEGGSERGRYSILGLPCDTVIRVADGTVQVEKDGVVVSTVDDVDPIEWIDAFVAKHRTPELEDLPSFTGGLVGYFGYATCGYIEPTLRADSRDDPLGLPEMLLMVSDEVLVFDNLRGKLYAIVHPDTTQADGFEQGQRRLDALVRKLRTTHLPPRLARPAPAAADFDVVAGSATPEPFRAAVERIKEYILAGDVMQVVISQRFSGPLQADPIDVYRALRATNPSPHMFHLNCGDFHIVGCSPEILVRLSDRKLTVRPIAGTRPRGDNHARDLELEEDLLADPKERAEHLMLIDLGRNDVGRVSEIGSVRLTEKMAIERYSHVMHMVSNVEGQLREDLRPVDVIRAAFPAGTVSGAPKVRAMEIIQELESSGRGIYSGAVGYLSWSGSIDTAIAIRTSIIKDGRLYVQAGAGIVADSVPDREWQEILNKAKAIFKATALAEAGVTTEFH